MLASRSFAQISRTQTSSKRSVAVRAEKKQVRYYLQTPSGAYPAPKNHRENRALTELRSRRPFLARPRLNKRNITDSPNMHIELALHRSHIGQKSL